MFRFYTHQLCDCGNHHLSSTPLYDYALPATGGPAAASLRACTAVPLESSASGNSPARASHGALNPCMPSSHSTQPDSKPPFAAALGKCSQLKSCLLLCHLFPQSRIWHHRTAVHQQGASTQPTPPVALGAYSNPDTAYACLWRNNQAGLIPMAQGPHVRRPDSGG